MYRELVCNDVAEPDLAKLIVVQTPIHERAQIRMHYIGHDAFDKRGSANTVVEQMEPELERGGLQRLNRANIARVSGWRLLYNCFAQARRLATWPKDQAFTQTAEDLPAFFVGPACTQFIQAVPMGICDDDNPQDIRKVPGAIEDDCLDAGRYLLASHLDARTDIPADVVAHQAYQAYQDPNARAMAMLRLSVKQGEGQRLQRKRRR